MQNIDINCDLGEGIGNDSLIMPFISSTNIACGYHAGDVNSMYQTIELAVKHGVAIGAHVSWLDKENFGRKEMELPPEDVYELIEQQLILFKEVADLFDKPVRHVKPHGALYNQSAKDPSLARAIARAVKDFDQHLVLVGLSGSHSVLEAKMIGLRTANEAFADRRYQNDGSLIPRSDTAALIEDPAEATTQVLQILNENTITAGSGRKLPIIADTICIHGDNRNAVEIARCIAEAMRK